MNTPIADFVRGYAKQNKARFHMPGHKGKSFLGCEGYDITEVAGADSLYETDGIIAESEANVTKIFGTGRTLYATEGSSQCIRAMLYLALNNRNAGTKPLLVATRNVHKSFVYAAAVLDYEVLWLRQEGDMNSLCSCYVSPQKLEETLEGLDEPPAAVYVTSPDYLGGQLDIRALAEVCHHHGTILAVDNAHGAYLHFLHPSQHPMDLGVDICCDSAHKTLPVLTGGAYLHISKDAPECFREYAKHALALFGSTSPSYLTLASLDLCNQYLVGDYRKRLADTEQRMRYLRKTLQDKGWKAEETEPLKLTVHMPEGTTGIKMAEQLRRHGIECEYADPEFVVCMATPENAEEDFGRLAEAFGENHSRYVTGQNLVAIAGKRAMSIRDAIFSEQECISIADAVGRICASPAISCPPAIPIVISGEVIDENAVRLFTHYGIDKVEVVKE